MFIVLLLLLVVGVLVCWGKVVFWVGVLVLFWFSYGVMSVWSYLEIVVWVWIELVLVLVVIVVVSVLGLCWWFGKKC